jgi:hypothetical protein
MDKKIRTQFDLNKISEVYRNNPNYKILNLNHGDQRCIIYFSSNGLYYPNQDSIFEREIMKKDRFEWGKNILMSVKKVIFVRDIMKQWYLTGINQEISSIDKLAGFLKKETEGLEIICVGSSAGGYAATLFGTLLKARCVFNFSGQFSLEHILHFPESRYKNQTLVKYENDPYYRQYYSIIDLVKNSDVPIFYFYPAKSQIDVEQSDLIEDLKNVYAFKFNSKRHGATCFVINFIDLFDLDIKEIIEIHSVYRNKLIKQIEFSLKISGFKKTLKYLGFQQPMILFKKLNKSVIG